MDSPSPDTSSPPTPVPRFLPIWGIPPTSPPICWEHDLRSVLALELDQMRYREKTEPYYRGETNMRPSYLDHDPDRDDDTDSDTDTDVSLGSADSDETMPASDADSDGYVIGDAPVHVTPIGRWSSAFLQDFGSFGVRTPTNSPTTTPSRQRRPPAELPTHSYTRAELEHFQFEVIRDWKGPTPVADRKGRVVGVLIDTPVQKDDWLAVVRDASAELQHVADNADFDVLPHHNTPNSIHWGIEYSGGGPFTSAPRNIRHENLDNLVEICHMSHRRSFHHISDWQNSVYSHFAPGLHTHVMATKKALLDHRLLFLRDTLAGSAFAASEAFLGSTESPPRLDDRDMLYAWRGLTGLGRYDPDFGGEVILWDEKKVIKFPVGSTFLFPAAFMRYSFTRVRPWERQFAFSQYSDAGLFRYVENGFMSEATFEATAWKSDRDARDRVRDARMQTALGMYSHLTDFA